jgi:hypothetical protein
MATISHQSNCQWPAFAKCLKSLAPLSRGPVVFDRLLSDVGKIPSAGGTLHINTKGQFGFIKVHRHKPAQDEISPAHPIEVRSTGSLAASKNGVYVVGIGSR